MRMKSNARELAEKVAKFQRELRPALVEGASEFRLEHRGENLGHFRLNVPGTHNVLNAAAAVATCLELGVGVEKIREALARYRGVDRRFQRVGEARGITVVDDYGHHPTEIRALIPAARRLTSGRLVAVFQPHRYTRTASLAAEFGGCFEGLDLLVILPIYSAGEEPIEGVTSELIARAVEAHGSPPCVCHDDFDSARSFLITQLQPGDSLLTIGAGDVYRLGEQLLADLGRQEGKA